jgi:protein ImuB
MFACLFLPPSPSSEADRRREDVRKLVDLVREFSPRVEDDRRGLVSLDVGGLGRLLGDAHAIGEELRRAAADRGLPVHVAVAGTRVAAMLLASMRPGLTIVPPGEEAARLADLPLSALMVVGGPPALGPQPLVPSSRPLVPTPQPLAPSPYSLLETLRRWGLKTLGEFVALPPVALFERLGHDGLRWQRLARGEDISPLVPDPPEEPFEASLDLEWPVERLEPLSFVLGRLFDQVCARLEHEDRAAVVLRVMLRLVTRETETRSLQLPAPMRDPRVLRTLVLLDLETRPVAAGIDRVTIAVDPVPGRVVQFSLLARALPVPEQVATLEARLTALVGADRTGAARLIDSHRPGAFVMTLFTPVTSGQWPVAIGRQAAGSRQRAAPTFSLAAERSVLFTASRRLPAASHSPDSLLPDLASPHLALRRFRLPVPARVLVRDDRPVRVTTERGDLNGGRVEAWAGPWRSSGEWWQIPDARLQPRFDGRLTQVGWDRDEWDVALSDGALYRIYRDRDRDRWFVDGIVD